MADGAKRQSIYAGHPSPFIICKGHYVKVKDSFLQLSIKEVDLPVLQRILFGTTGQCFNHK